VGEVLCRREVPDAQAKRARTGNGVVDIDLGVKTAVTLSTGEAIDSPKPLKAALRRMKIRGRRHSKAVRGSHNRKKLSARLAKLHRRIANLRADFCHKLTTRLCRENQTVVIENLNVRGMMANRKLARHISDIGFSMLRYQLEYKALRYDTQIVVADRWYPSSRLCSSCGWKNIGLTLSDREWACPQCGGIHDRDINAAINLQRLASVTALPVASQAATSDAAAGVVPAAAGKVTPVRYESGQQGGSGQELNSAHNCALS
jgi:putative transposase